MFLSPQEGPAVRHINALLPAVLTGDDPIGRRGLSSLLEPGRVWLCDLWGRDATRWLLRLVIEALPSRTGNPALGAPKPSPKGPAHP